MQIIKRHGGWKSNSTAEGYLEDSVNNKICTSGNIFKCATEQTTSKTIALNNRIEPSYTSTSETQVNSGNTTLHKNIDIVRSISTYISNLTGCTINIYNCEKQ